MDTGGRSGRKFFKSSNKKAYIEMNAPSNAYRKTCSTCKKEKTARSFRFARPAQLRKVCNACYLNTLIADTTGKKVSAAQAKQLVGPAQGARLHAEIRGRKDSTRKKESVRKSKAMTEYHASRRGNSGV